MQNTFDNWEGEGLQHYGVLGMKWGFRKDPNRTFERALAKKNKLDDKAMKRKNQALNATGSDLKYQTRVVKTTEKLRKSDMKVDKWTKRSEKHADKNLTEKVAKDQSKIAKYQNRSAKLTIKLDKAKAQAMVSDLGKKKADFKSSKAALKAEKWSRDMLNVFGEVSMDDLMRKYRTNAA